MIAKRLLALLPFVLAAGCDDAGTPRAADAASSDAAVHLDARPVDAAPHDAIVHDAAVRDAVVHDVVTPDAVVRDALVRDAAPLDATRLDGAPPLRDAGDASRPTADGAVTPQDASRPVVDAADATPPVRDSGDVQPPRDAIVDAAPDLDARPPLDAAVPDAAPVPDAGPPDACVGVALPPSVASPDGTEVCNYIDDDGDGLVDEGFQYQYLGDAVRFVPEPQTIASAVADYQMAWTGDGYGIAWDGNGYLNFIKVDENGCPTGPKQIVDQNPDDFDAIVIVHSVAMRFAGDRFALAFTQRRRAGVPGEGRLTTFVRMFDRAGNPVGDFITLNPNDANDGRNAMAVMGDRFAVFAGAFDPETLVASTSDYVVLDQEGHIVTGPVATFQGDEDRGINLTKMIGMD